MAQTPGSPSRCPIPESDIAFYDALILQSTAKGLKASIAECDNPISLLEVARELKEVESAITDRLTEIRAKVERLYFTGALVDAVA